MEEDKDKRKQHYNNHQKQRRNPLSSPLKIPVKVEESPLEEAVATLSQKNTIIQSASSNKQRHYHNKTFFLHNNNNSSADSSKSDNNNTDKTNYSSCSKNYLNLNKNLQESSLSSSTSTSRSIPIQKKKITFATSPLPNGNRKSSSGCPNCCKNRSAAEAVNPEKFQRKSILRRPPSTLSMEPGEHTDLHRKRVDRNNGGGGSNDAGTVTASLDDDDDQPRDSLEDTQPVLHYDDGENDDEDVEDNDNGDELSREDLIRFLLANSTGVSSGGSGALQSYQFLQQQLLQHQGGGGGAMGGFGGPLTSMHGAVGGVGLEPIMDASFQDDFDDIHSDYQWFTESG